MKEKKLKEHPHQLMKIRMIKKHFTVGLLLFSVKAFTQTNPLDTSYYDNGVIKSILFKNDEDITGYQVEVFYFKSNKIGLGTRQSDTLYEHQPGWQVVTKIENLDKKLIRVSRKYLPDSSCIEKHIFISGIDPLTFSFSSVSVFLKKESIYITYHYKYNKAIALYISEEDPKDEKKLKNIINIISDKEINNRFQEFLITKNRRVRIECSDASIYMSRIIFMNSKEEWKGLYVEFYNGFAPKELGEIESQRKVGLWYEWGETGFLKSTGAYGDTTFDEMGNATFLKNGNWKYFDESGKIIKTEKWENGKIIE